VKYPTLTSCAEHCPALESKLADAIYCVEKLQLIEVNTASACGSLKSRIVMVFEGLKADNTKWLKILGGMRWYCRTDDLTSVAKLNKLKSAV
jgi:hypothetical protein